MIGTPFSDYIVGTAASEEIYGGGGADVIKGGGGADVAARRRRWRLSERLPGPRCSAKAGTTAVTACRRDASRLRL